MIIAFFSFPTETLTLFHSYRLDTRRNVIKADLGLAKKGQFPIGLVETAHR